MEDMKEYDDSPREQKERWSKEIEASLQRRKSLDKDIEKIFKKFAPTGESMREDSKRVRVNLFHSNITTLLSMLYGRMPKVDVDRKFADADDDLSRVSAEILQRMLNEDIEHPGDDYVHILKYALSDRLIGGIGQARCRYSPTFKKMEVDAEDGITDDEGNPLTEIDVIASEKVDIDYVHWKDFIWGWGRTWKEVPWVGFRVYLSKKQAKKRFGEEIANKLSYKNVAPTEDSGEDQKDVNPKACGWEIWCKEERKVYWCMDGLDELADVRNDPLGLDQFLPCPQPMMANLTTTNFMPVPDYVIAQDLYQEIDELECRISNLVTACRVLGVYDKSVGEIQRLFSEGMDNDLIPVENWANFSEKQGLKGSMDIFDLQPIVNTIDILTKVRNDKVNFLYQVTGLADILRGASTEGATATEQSIKAKFASVRVQALQDEFAQFATSIMQLKAEIVLKHFQPATIAERSNIGNTPDRDVAADAINYMKTNPILHSKIAVRPESVAMVDYAQLKVERSEYITALSTFLQSSFRFVETFPQAGPTLMELMKWGLAGFKGSRQIEGVLDKAIEQLTKNPPQPKDDSGAEQAKQQAEMQKMQLSMQQAQMQHEAKMQEIAVKQNAELTKLYETLKADLMRLRAQDQSNLLKEQAQYEFRDKEKSNAP